MMVAKMMKVVVAMVKVMDGECGNGSGANGAMRWW